MSKYLVGIFFLMVVISKTTIAQTNLDPPIIKEISVLDNGEVLIKWELVDTGAVIVEINKLPLPSQSPEYTEVDTIYDPFTNQYTHSTASADTMVRIYRLFAGNDDGTSSPNFPTTLLSSKFDTCYSEVILNWTNYLRFYESIIDIKEYEIYQVLGADTTYLRTVPRDQKTDTIYNVQANTDYYFYVNLIPEHAPNYKSKSNTLHVFTEMSQNPDYIDAISATVNGSDINLKFDIDPNSELDTYKLLKSSSLTGDYDTLETITTTASTVTATDSDAYPDNTINYYKLISVNECGVETTNSDVINNILLEIDTDNFDNSLTWNELKDGTSVNYKIYRIITELGPELIGDRSFNYYDDNIESYQNYTQFCYYVQAIESGTPADDYSKSNTVCVYLKPKVFIPEAFTPNGDGLNEEFKPVFSFVPSSYLLKVFNRWGNILFETSDYSKPWNGKETNGNSAPAGAYIYYVKLTTPNGQSFEQRGSVMVIYP